MAKRNTDLSGDIYPEAWTNLMLESWIPGANGRGVRKYLARSAVGRWLGRISWRHPKPSKAYEPTKEMAEHLVRERLDTLKGLQPYILGKDGDSAPYLERLFGDMLAQPQGLRLFAALLEQIRKADAVSGSAMMTQPAFSTLTGVFGRGGARTIRRWTSLPPEDDRRDVRERVSQWASGEIGRWPMFDDILLGMVALGTPDLTAQALDERIEAAADLIESADRLKHTIASESLMEWSGQSGAPLLSFRSLIMNICRNRIAVMYSSSGLDSRHLVPDGTLLWLWRWIRTPEAAGTPCGEDVALFADLETRLAKMSLARLEACGFTEGDAIAMTGSASGDVRQAAFLLLSQEFSRTGGGGRDGLTLSGAVGCVMASSYNPTVSEIEDLLEYLDRPDAPEHVLVAAALIAGCSEVVARSKDAKVRQERSKESRLRLTAMLPAAPKEALLAGPAEITTMLQGTEADQFLAIRRGRVASSRSI